MHLWVATRLITSDDQQKCLKKCLSETIEALKGFVKHALFCSLLLTLSGCASIAGNNTRMVKVESQPLGAAIYLDNQRYGVTPAVITLPNYIYGGKNILLKKEGYHDQCMMINSSFQPIALLDIFFWPTFLIDAATGYIVKIDPANLNLYAALQKVEDKDSGCSMISPSFVPTSGFQRPPTSTNAIQVYYDKQEVPFKYREIGRVFLKNINYWADRDPSGQINKIREEAAFYGADAVIILVEKR